MKHNYQRSKVNMFMVPAIMGLIVWAGAACAADWQPSEPGAQTPDFQMVDGSSTMWYGDGPMPDDNKVVNDGRAPAATFSYYTVSGATLRGRSSTAGYTYQSLGCVYSTTSADTFLNTELPIPDGSIIKYLRIYYKDTSATERVYGYLTRYQPGVVYSDLTIIDSTAAFAGGFGSALSAELNEVVDNSTYAYTLIGRPSGASSSLQICGLRIAYYAP